MLVEDSSPKEVTKRWGFRRSTIAKREFMEEIGNLDISSVSAPRRGARQARGRGRGRGRGKDAGEMPSTSPAPKRGRGGRRSAPADLAPVSSPTDGNTILELGGGDCAAASDQAEDSDDLTLRELQERARNRQKLEEASTLSVPDLNLNTKSVNKDVEEVDVQKTCLQMEKNAVQEDTTPQKASRTSKKDQKRGVRKDEEEEQNEDTHKSSHDSEENDPNALYCIFVAAVLEHEKEEKVEQEVAEEKAAVPKCIGPGCDNSALPESVYCGHQCIIRHAAVAMQSISEPKTEPQIQTIQTKPAPKPIPKVNQTFCSVLLVKTENGDVESKAETKQDAPQPPNLPAPSDGPEKDEKTEKVNEKAASSAPLLRKPGSNPLPSRAKKTMPGSPRLAGLKLLQTEPPQVNKGTLTVPEKPLQSQEATAVPQNPTASSGQASEIRVLPVTPAPVPPPRPLQAHPNMQMRQNIRRSLTDTLMKRLEQIRYGLIIKCKFLIISVTAVLTLSIFFIFRVTESDDLEISESDVGKLAVNIEREMFNMYYTTDSKYKNKYRTLLLSLKDPKNKGLFYQVIKGQITPFKLTRLSQQDIVTCPVFMEAQSSFNFFPVKEEKASASQVKPAQPRKVSTAVSDIVSSMLKDTTSEHRAHLFDLKCRICTGQISADEDTDVKIFKKEELKDEDEEKTPWVIPMFDTKPPNPTPVETDPIMESPASPTADDSSVETASSDFSPLVIPEVSVVSITRRDPRTASYRPAPSPSVAATSAPPTPQCPPLMPTEKEAVEVTKAVDPLPLPPPPPMPKSILMKPSAPSVLTSSHNPTENETSQFLSKQDTVWKGFLNMQTVAKFVTKGYLISGLGSAELLKKDLPDTIHIGGRILPQTVWEYVDKVKTSVTKEMSVIRFHPATDEEEVAYVSLFSYFNSRRRFGVVSNICNSIKDLYLIPLCAKESIPSVLLPLEGPGLEEQHPNLLIGLAICQKLKRLGTQAQEIDEKRPRIQIPLDSQGMIPIIKPAVLETTSSDLPPSSGAGTSSSTTPLQTILNTLFGKRTQDTVDTYDNDRPYDPEEEYDQGIGYPSITTSSLIQMSTPNPVTAVCKVDDDNRPYDPEEEYNLGNNVDAVTSVATKSSETLPSVNTSAVHDDVAYDPEDETVFEEMQTYLAYNKPSTSQYGLASTVSLSEQQKMLEELNRQIEEQKRQLEEQEEALRLQRAAVGVSMAHFSVSDALMSPPPCFGREPEDAAEKTSVVPLINPCRDPRQCKNVKQDAVSGNLTTVHNERENSLREISVRKQALTQATFLVPSNSLVMQDLSKTEQELMLDVKKNLDMPSNHQHSHSHTKVSGKSRHSRTSKWDNSSSKTQSRQDRRSHHEDRSSRVSKDEADRYRRKDRHSPDRSSRQSRTHSNREERVSTSRHRSRRDRHSIRSHLSRSGKSAQPKNDKSCQRDQSPSRQRTESVQQTQSINQTASGPPKSQGDASQIEASEDGEQNLPEVPKEVFTKTENAQPLSWQSSDPPGATFSQNYKISQSNENKPASGSLLAQKDHPDKDLKAKYQNRDKLEVLKDNFAQKDPSELPPEMDKSTFSYSQAKSQFFQSGDVSQVEPDPCNENKAPPFGKNRLHRDDFSEDESDQF
uniref:TFIIS central domain-containing protein n=1 Tax=Pygocentrus nattereri TaxID=42514 RepID=A0AAR2JEY3_PYGNA